MITRQYRDFIITRRAGNYSPWVAERGEVEFVGEDLYDVETAIDRWHEDSEREAICVCSIPGCGKPHYVRGWCNSHYRRWKKHGDPLGGRTPNGEPMRFFREVVVPFGGDDCLIWPYGRDGKGYARMDAGKLGTYVHRLACEVEYGPPPTPEHEAAHSCGKGHEGCVNPTHVRWATKKENSADRLLHGTSNRGERNNTTKLTEADVGAICEMLGTMRQADIARQFSVSRQTVTAIHTRKSWVWREAVAGVDAQGAKLDATLAEIAGQEFAA